MSNHAKTIPTSIYTKLLQLITIAAEQNGFDSSNFRATLKGFNQQDRADVTVLLAQLSETISAEVNPEVHKVLAQAENPTQVQWRHIQKQLLEKCDRKEPWTSYRKMAKELNCSPATIHKAVKEYSKLSSWVMRARLTKIKYLTEQDVDHFLDNVFLYEKEEFYADAASPRERLELAQLILEHQMDRYVQEKSPKGNRVYQEILRKGRAHKRLQ